MKHHLQLVGALLRKDFRLVWLFASLSAVLIVLLQFPPVLRQLQDLAEALVVGARVLSTVLLILVIFHEDATASVEHDWLTRPVAGLTLLLAKCAFVALAILAPAVLGGIAYELYMGRSLAESVLTAVASAAGGSGLTFGLAVMAVAAVTANVRQAIIVFLAGILTLVLVLIAAGLGMVTFGPYNGLNGMRLTGFGGSGWVIGRALEIMLVLLTVSALWVQYRVRHTYAARVIIGVAVVAVCALIVSMTSSRVFAVQRFFSGDPAAAASIDLELAQGCFPAHVFNVSRSPAVGASAPEPADEQRKRAAAGDIVFSTRSILKGMPAGDRLTAEQVKLTYRAAGAVVQTLPHPPPQFPAARLMVDGGLLAASHDWLLPRSTYDQLKKDRDVEVDIDYFLSLLAPRASAEFLADGRRMFYPGIGYCGATLSPAAGVVNVDCFKWGVQPAQIVASLANMPESARSPSGYPDFAPAALDFWGGQTRVMRLRAEGSGIPRVKLTAFAAVAHFPRHIVVPGVLGGPIASCPAP